MVSRIFLAFDFRCQNVKKRLLRYGPAYREPPSYVLWVLRNDERISTHDVPTFMYMTHM